MIYIMSLFLMICGVLFGRNKIVLCNLNFDLCYTGPEGKFKSLFTQSDVRRNAEFKSWAENNGFEDFAKQYIYAERRNFNSLRG